MLSLLNHDGKMLITFGPPSYAPYGSHMRFFSKIPWLNIWFSEKTVMAVQRAYSPSWMQRQITRVLGERSEAEGLELYANARRSIPCLIDCLPAGK